MNLCFNPCMYLIQFLLPLYDNQKRPYPHADYDRIFQELTGKFGGVTAYPRSPAQGAWKAGGQVQYDDVVVFEVMADALDRAWWKDFRENLQKRFRQDEILLRASQVEQI